MSSSLTINSSSDGTTSLAELEALNFIVEDYDSNLDALRYRIYHKTAQKFHYSLTFDAYLTDD